MKLLDKKTTNTLIASQKKVQIDEGVALATRIDKLRATLAGLEAQQAAFVEGMQNELRKKTQPLHEELANLTREVADLKEQRKKLLEPLNEEWAKVRDKEHTLRGKEIYLDERLKLLRQQQDECDAKKLELHDRIKDAERNVEATNENLKVAEQERLRAAELLATACVKADEVAIESSKKKRALTEREKGISARERELDIENVHIASEKQRLAVKEKQLNDREATMQRTITRLSKKGINV